MVEGPIGTEEQAIGTQSLDEFVNLSNALTVDIKKDVRVSKSKGNRIGYVSGSCMSQDEVDIGMFGHSGFVVADEREAVRIARFNSCTTSMEKYGESEASAFLVDEIHLGIIWEKALDGGM